MRKFKFMSKAVVGMMAAAMTMGSFSSVAFSQPIAIYAAINSIAVEEDIAEGASETPHTAGATINFKATLGTGDNLDGKELVWESSDTTVATVARDTTDSTKATVTIASNAEKDAEAIITVYYKKGEADAKSADYTITVVDTSESQEPGEYSMEAWIDAGPMTLTVCTTDPYFTVDVLKTAGDTAKPSKSYTYANNAKGCVIIDLGFLKVKKENILNVYGASVTDKTKGEILTIEGQPSKDKFTVDATQSRLADALDIDEKDVSLYQYTSSFRDEWFDLDIFDFDAAKVAGTTIIVRKKANDVAATATTAAKSTPAGPEVKVKIPASAKAPKVTVDYAKDIVKVSDKMQYALLGNTPIAEKDWKLADKGGMTRSKIATELGIAAADQAGAFTIVVRTKASGKKSASMPVIVPIKATSELVGNKETAPDSATVRIGTATTTIKADKTDNGVTFTITGNAAFQYDKGNDKWANITSGKEIKITTSTVSVRVAPEKEDKDTAGSGAFASNVVVLTPAAKSAQSKVSKVEVTSEGTVVLENSSDTTLTLSATVTAAEGVTLTDDEKGVTWSVKSATKFDGTDIVIEGDNAQVSIANDTLTIKANAADVGTEIIVTATPKADASKAIDFTIKVVAQ